MRISKRQYRALIKINYDLFDDIDDKTIDNSQRIINECGTSCENILPEIDILYHLFDQYNAELFDRSLPQAKISYSDKMLIAGSYNPASKEIKIGVKYHNIFPDELSDTLKHEMIHIIHPRHDRNFKSLAARLGVSLKARPHPDLRGAFKYLYVCPVCGREYPRRKRLRMASCGVCSRGNRFDPEFKLHIIKSQKRQN